MNKKKKVIQMNNIMILGRCEDYYDVVHLNQLICKGRELANQMEYGLICVCYGTFHNSVVDIVFREYLDECVFLHNEDSFNEDIFQEDVISLIEKLKPYLIIMKSSIFDKSLSVIIASKLNIGLVADCIQIQLTNNDVLFSRPAYEASVIADIICKTPNMKMCTVKRNVFLSVPADKSYKCSIDMIEVLKKQSRIKLICREPVEQSDHLEKSKCIVTVGSGVGSKENCETLKQFAKSINAGFGATRAVVENGWVSFSNQIGMSGINVTPSLYITFGVSGALQHMIGVREPKHLIAINKDSNANIFRYADTAIVEKIENIIPNLIDFANKNL